MNNNEAVKCRYTILKRKTIFKSHECLQYFVRQGMPLRGNGNSNDNLTELIISGKRPPVHCERLLSNVCREKSYTHHDFQDELLFIMSNQLLRRKLCDVIIANFSHDVR